MNIAEEKEYLYQTMKLMLEERRLISDELLEIRKRINKLTDFQELGISDIPAIDYISLRKSLNEKKYETVRDVTKNVHDAYKKTMHYATPQDTPTDYGENFEKKEEKNHIIIEEIQDEKEQKSFVDTWEDISIKEKEELKPIKSSNIKKKKPSFERMSTVVINLLKESGMPLDTHTIRKHLEETLDYTFSGNGFSMVLWKVKKENERIEQPSRGFYQYKR